MILKLNLIKFLHFMSFILMCIQNNGVFQIWIDIYTIQIKYFNTIQQELLPVSLFIFKIIQNVVNHKVLMALFDGGGTTSWNHYLVLFSELMLWIRTKNKYLPCHRQFLGQGAVKQGVPLLWLLKVFCTTTT